MIRLLGLSLMMFYASPGLGQWSISSKATEAMEEQTRAASEDVWLKVTIRNDSGDTLYVEGIQWDPPWYMVEAYIKHDDDDVWERQNVGVDQKLEMLPVAPGAEFEVVRREAKKSIGSAMMLTFTMARSENDETGTSILLGPFEMPDLE